MPKGLMGFQRGNKLGTLHTLPRESRLCLCGCGKSFICKTNSKQKYIHGHNGVNNKVAREIRPCICGCGQTFECRVNSKQKYITGHNTTKETGRRVGKLALSNRAKAVETRLARAKERGYYHSTEARKKMSDSVLNKEYTRPNKCFNTKPEILMKEILNSLNILYKFQTNLLKMKIDFYLPKENIVIEVDGKYWHAYPSEIKGLDQKIGSLTAKEIWERDFRRTLQLRQAGHKVPRFWENEFNLEKVKSAIEEIQSPLICT